MTRREGKADDRVQRLTVYLPRELHKRLRIAALEADTSTTKLVEQLITDYLAKLDGKRGRG